jgi:ferredoxin-type protein NapH
VRWTRARRAVQGATAALYVALPFLAEPALTGTAAALRVGPVDLAEPAGALSAALAAGALPLALALGVLPVLALAVALGPVSCSWLCPFGLLSEGIDRLRGRGAAVPAVDPARHRRRRALLVAALLALSAATGAPLAALLSPPRLVTALPLEAICGRVVPWVTLGLLAAWLAVDALGPRRIVCRTLCPAGALAALLRRPFTWGPRFTEGPCRCPGAPPCRQACPWALDPRRMVARDGCTSCMACVEVCPSSALRAPTLRSGRRMRGSEPERGPSDRMGLRRDAHASDRGVGSTLSAAGAGAVLAKREDDPCEANP